MATEYPAFNIFKVTVLGSVIIEANDGPDAQAKAVAYWESGGEGLDFNIEQMNLVKPTEVP